MSDSERAGQLHAALRFVITTEAVSAHKAILIDVLLQALRDDESAAARRREETLDAGRAWQDHELALLSDCLQHRVANSWQDADERVMHVAGQLHRDARSIRDKAAELGFDAAVDYRSAAALRRSQQG